MAARCTLVRAGVVSWARSEAQELGLTAGQTDVREDGSGVEASTEPVGVGQGRPRLADLS